MILGIDLEQGTDFCTFFFLNSLLSFLFLFLHLASQYYDSTDRYLSLYRSQLMNIESCMSSRRRRRKHKAQCFRNIEIEIELAYNSRLDVRRFHLSAAQSIAAPFLISSRLDFLWFS